MKLVLDIGAFRRTSLLAAGAAAITPPDVEQFVLDIGAFRRTSLLAAGAAAVATPEAEQSERPERMEGASVIDFGLGDEVVEEVWPQSTVYRGHAQTVRVFRGSGLRARAALGRAIAADALAIVFAVALLLMQAAHITGAI